MNHKHSVQTEHNSTKYFYNLFVNLSSACYHASIHDNEQWDIWTSNAHYTTSSAKQ